MIGSIAKTAAVHGTRLGVAGDILLTDADGNSNISGADYAIRAFVDEAGQPTNRRQRSSVAY